MRWRTRCSRWAALVDIKINEKVATADGLTVRALHVKVIRGNGTPLADVVVAESKVGYDGLVCDPNAQDGDGSRRARARRAPSTTPAQNVCIIRASTSGSSQGDIIVGPPFSGPSGGKVVPLDVARRLYGRTPCLCGSGNPKFAIVGTNKADRITGTNVADRIIGLGGGDKLDGGRGNDCIEGRTGGDTMSGGLGNDRIYGSSGKDHLVGGSGKDYLSAGSGNDTVNAGFGGDRVLGGSGIDFINVATAGPAASVSCGSRSRQGPREPQRDARSSRAARRSTSSETSRSHAAARTDRTGGADYSPAREPPRADQDDAGRGPCVPRRGAHGRLRDQRQGRISAPHAAVVRRT